MNPIACFKSFPWLVLVVLMTAMGCATKSTVESRKAERPMAFASLPPDHQELVAEGQVVVGMSEDAVYIAWGKPAQVLHSADATGARNTWLYYGTTSDTYTYWDYYHVPRPRGGSYLGRTMRRDLAVRGYISAELVFKDGLLESFRTLPKPPQRHYDSPWF